MPCLIPETSSIVKKNCDVPFKNSTRVLFVLNCLCFAACETDE